MSHRTRIASAATAVVLVFLSTRIASAQKANPAPQQPPMFSPAGGVTVQLPTFSFFGISTSVLVPDRGRASLGGSGSSSQGRSSRGAPLLPGNVGVGGAAGAGGVDVLAWIHDLSTLDKELLAEAAARRRTEERSEPPVVPQSKVAAQAPGSVAELRRQHEAAAEIRQDEAEAEFAKARAMVAAGKPGVARIHYQMAERRATGELRNAIAAELARLKSPVAKK